MPYLRGLVDGYPNVVVSTFGKFSYGLGFKISLEGGEQAAADLAAAKAKGIRPVIDALLIDEAQDFDDSWIGFAVATVRLARGGCVLAAIPGRHSTGTRLSLPYLTDRGWPS